MKNVLLLSLLTVFLLGCSKSVDPNPTTPNPIGEWVAAKGGGGGFNNFESFKNYQYTFEVETANQVVGVGLTSPDINVQYALFDPLGQRIDASSQGRDLSKPYTLNAGKYRLVVASDRRAVGRFTLSLAGTKAGAARIPSQILQSDTQNWGKLGGGGRNVSFKNHFYTFDVTEDNNSVDIELESADTDVALYVYNPLGQQIASQLNSRYVFQIKAINKGTYKVMAATDTRGSIGNYNLRVIGKVSNLQRVESQSTSVTGIWDVNTPKYRLYPYPPFDTYSIQLTTNSPLDIDLSSADVEVRIQLQTSVGDQLGFSAANKATALLGDLSKAVYRIQVYPFKQEYGSYTLTVHGQFTDFKKL